jgi:hypothetical protein
MNGETYISNTSSPVIHALACFETRLFARMVSCDKPGSDSVSVGGAVVIPSCASDLMLVDCLDSNSVLGSFPEHLNHFIVASHK